MKLHLLEPYRSALMVLALNEGLMRGVNAEVRDISAAYKAANSKELLQETMQLMVLGEEVSMLWTHVANEEDHNESGYEYVETSGLESLDILRIIGTESLEFRDNGWPSGTDFPAIWRARREFIDAHYPIALEQLSSRGKPFSLGVFRLLRAFRLGETSVIPLIYSTLSDQDKENANLILSGDPVSELVFDLPIMGTFRHLSVGLADHKNNECKLVGLPFAELLSSEKNNARHIRGSKSAEVWALVVETLLERDLTFPLPESLKDVNNLRHAPEISSFRRFLAPWIVSIVSGDFSDYEVLKQEIQSCLKAFERYPNTRRVGNFIGYTSLAGSVVEAAFGVIGPSLVGGLVGIGMTQLANDWEKRSGWLYLSV